MDEAKQSRAERVLAELTEGAVRSKVLHLLVTHDIGTILGQEGAGYLTAEEICGRTVKRLLPDHVERVLRYAACLGVVEERGRDGVAEFGRTAVSDMLMKSDGAAVNSRWQILLRCAEVTLERNHLLVNNAYCFFTTSKSVDSYENSFSGVENLGQKE